MTPGEVYHLYNRGNLKQVIFLDKRDWARFIFLVLYFQSPTTFENIAYAISDYLKKGLFRVSAKTRKKIVRDRFVSLLGFILMPNHFHLIVQEEKESGIAQYMQRVLNAYTKYFNTKYKLSGHLFQGPYQAVHIKDNDQLLYTSAYIHRNCRELPGWKNKEHEYQWSSYQDYVSTNRWNELLATDLILDQFKNQSEYLAWVNESGAKDLAEEISFDEDK